MKPPLTPRSPLHFPLPLNPFPPQIWAGSPAKLLRPLSPAEKAFIPESASSYAKLAAAHAEENAKSFEQVEAEKEQRVKWAFYDPDAAASMGTDLPPPPTGEPIKA